jgi:hypothetical protein
MSCAAFRLGKIGCRYFTSGGHASESSLLFEDAEGHHREAGAAGLAGFLGKQRGLVLVFLNGCCTEPQVKLLRAAGVKAVVATTSEVRDDVAAEFARAFYVELAARPLREAFDAAVAAIRMLHGDDPDAVRRDVAKASARSVGRAGWPWIIECDPAVASWRLGTEVRRRRLRLLVALGAPLLLLLSLMMSAAARRAVGMGQAPSEVEQARWEQAIAMRSGDGLRSYLTAFPRSVYAAEAQARLAACKRENVERLDPPREVRHRLTVNPRREASLASEVAARDDAKARGQADAEVTCQVYRRGGELLSAETSPMQWKCFEVTGGFACGFDGDIVCRVRDRVETEVEHCNGKR